MISLTWSTEEKLFCAFVESIIISVWLTVCLVEFCSYTQTESYLITRDFREGALKYHQERSDCLGAWRILLGRCRTSFSKLLWEVTQREILQWLEQAAQEQDLKLVLVRLSSGSTAESLRWENGVGFIPSGLRGTACALVLLGWLAVWLIPMFGNVWAFWSDLSLPGAWTRYRETSPSLGLWKSLDWTYKVAVVLLYWHRQLLQY